MPHYINDWIETNRTEYLAKSTSSKFNPSFAVYKAAKFLIEHYFKFTYVHHVYLIPNSLLNSSFLNYSFIWFIAFSDFNLDHAFDSPLYITRYLFYFDNNTNLIRFSIKHDTYRSRPPICCSPQSQPLILYVSILLAATILIAISTLYYLQKRKRNKYTH